MTKLKLSEKLVELYLRKGDTTKWFLIKFINFSGFLALVFIVLLIITFANSSISNFYAIIPLAILILLSIFNKKLIIIKINFYSSIIIHYLKNKNPNIPDIFFDNLYSEIESLKNDIDSEDPNVFDFYLIYLKYFLYNRFHNNLVDTGSTISFIRESFKAFSSENISSIPYIISQDFMNLKKSDDKDIVKNSINGLIKVKINFNQDVMSTLRKIHDKLNRQPPKKFNKIVKLAFDKPLNAILFIFLILLVLFIILSLFNRDTSKITPLFDTINNLIRSITCK